MKILKIPLITFILLMNLAIVASSWADGISHISANSDYLLGQKVIWLYKVRADSENT